ncbi:MAG TPA: hypothetical protein VLF61_02790, partial [Rhabdochlamydiaceae bacterium]|nr:hypothetical protein [Rhabdochlamydiaceae bacterium]
MLIKLPAALSEDLDWHRQKKIAQEFVDQGLSILWHLDLGLSSHSFQPHDSSAFFSYTLAIEQFLKELW